MNNMTVKKLNKILALALAVTLTVGLLPIRASAATVTFTDVPTGAWYYADVTRLANAGVIEGVGNNRFVPDNNISNAEMVKLIVNAFYRSEYETYEAANYETMRNHFSNNNLYWFSFMCYYAEKTGLLNGIDINIDSYASCYTPMSRYDMALLLANTVKAKGIMATAEQKTAAQASIADYSSIPAKYQDAVKTCFALKTKNASGESKSLIEGNNGRFNGTANMTRAQACAVIVRLENLIINGDSTMEPTTPASGKEIKVSSEFWSGQHNGSTTSGNAWAVTDNGFGTGYLNNGKEITEANVLELIRQAEATWTDGIRWTSTGGGNNFYKSSGTVVSTMLKTPNTGAKTNLNSNFVCGGYVAMISDYIFGRDNNNFHKVADISQIRPGDIILEVDKSTNEIEHAFVAISTPGGSYTGTDGTTVGPARAGYLYYTDGNNNKTVCWSNQYRSSIAYSGSEAANYTWLIYSRYPTPGTSGTPTTSAPASGTQIKVSSESWTVRGTSGLAWTVTDNGFSDGYLNNGKPITEENVLELLRQAEGIWTQDTRWSTSTSGAGNNFYKDSGSVVSVMMKTPNTGAAFNLNTNFACGGYAAMISDYIFGRDNNNFHRVYDVSQIRPGDIILYLNKSTNHIDHAVVAVSTPGGTYTSKDGWTTPQSHDGYVHLTDGNNSDKIKWPTEYSGPVGYVGNLAATYNWLIYSRYPT